MKLTAIIGAYNEALFLNYCIKSIYNFVDEIIFIDEGMEAAISAGYGKRSTDGTSEIIDTYVRTSNKCFLAPLREKSPKSFKELSISAYELAKKRNANWTFFICGDEIWPANCLKPMKTILSNFEKKGIMALNVWMNIFAPDFWHYKDFRNPRLAKITEDVELISGDAVCWPKRNLYQFAGSIDKFSPNYIAKSIKKINADYPRTLKVFHYSCVGKERILFKTNFYKKFNNTYGDQYNKAYIEKDWKLFEKEGFKEFKGNHPNIMKNHPLHGEKLY